MEQRVDPLRELGRAVADAQDALLARSAASKREAPSVVDRRAARRRRVWAWGGAGVVTAAAAAAIVLWIRPSEEPLAFFAGDRRAGVGEWIAAPSSASLRVRFSDGTRFDLEPATRVRVTEVTSRGARVLLERGRSRVAVVHRRQGQAWQVGVGPFEVRVTGTRFDVGWDPESERFELALHEGHVVVSGPMLEGGHDVRAGQSLLAEVANGRVEIRDEHSVAQAARIPDVPPPSPVAVPSDVVLPDEASRSIGREDGWIDLARAGKYRDAMQALDRVGFDRALDRSAPHQWSLLADTARFSARFVEAERVYARMRERGNAAASATAAFELGRILFDRRTRYHEAAVWFATYLREAPNGPLAEDALGRLMEAQHQSGQRSEARASAARYLGRYPRGTHANFARSLIPQ